MSVSADDQGQCPSCGSTGAVGDACTERVCGRWGFRFIPVHFVTWAGREPPPALVGRTVGKALIVKVLGAGGFGTVYQGLQLPVFMEVAVKLLHRHDDPLVLAQILKKFEGEARALARLNHPNIVRLVDYGEQEGSPYLIMEYVPGSRTLKGEIADRALRGEGLKSSEAHTILRQTVDGLSAAHAAGFLHRDVKPENLMLQTVEGTPLFVRIVDFGLAKFTAERTGSSKAMGTPAYMSPEHLLQGELGPWSDLYAVGAVAFELLTGRRPFPGRTSQEIVVKKVDPTYDPLSRITDIPLPDITRAFLKRALAREPAERFRSGHDFRDALEKAMAAFDDGFESSTGPLDVSGLLDSSDLARVGAERRRLEEERARLEEEKARLGEERRKLEDERHSLAEAAERSRGDARGTNELSESVPVEASVPIDLLEPSRKSRWALAIGLTALVAALALAMIFLTEPAAEVSTVPPVPLAPGVEPNATEDAAVVPGPGPEPAPIAEPPIRPFDGGTKTPVPAPSEPPPVRKPEREPQTVTYSSEPGGAEVFLNGERLCVTPCEVRFSGDPPWMVSIRYEEFESWEARYLSRAAVDELRGRKSVRLEME